MRSGPLVVGAGVAAGLLLQGCATAKPVVYGPIGPEAPYGYSEVKNPDGGFTVLITMPGSASPPALRDFLDRRAAELCAAGVDRTNVFRVTANEYYARGAYVYGGASVGSRGRIGTEMEGYVYCKPGPAAPATAAATDAKAEGTP